VDAVLFAEPMHAVLARGDAVFGRELVCDEAVAEDRIVGVDLACGIDQVRV
jgi:hypothetical protein